MQGIKWRSEIPCFLRPREHLRWSRPIVVQLFPGRTTSEASKDRSGSQEGSFSLLRSTLTTASIPGRNPGLIPHLARHQAPSQEARGHLDAVFRQRSLCTGEWLHAGNIKSRRCSQRGGRPTWRCSTRQLETGEESGTWRTSSQQAVSIWPTYFREAEEHPWTW